MLKTLFQVVGVETFSSTCLKAVEGIALPAAVGGAANQTNEPSGQRRVADVHFVWYAEN